MAQARGEKLLHDTENDEADYFACCLLMPIEWIARDCIGVDLMSDKDMRELAKKYQVSVSLLSYWIGYLRATRKIGVSST